LTGKIRVLLIEDNRFLREGIADVLQGHGNFVVDARADGDGWTGKLKV
jgi:chemotaxis response regulator CheB